MSRIGKQPVELPSGVLASFVDGVISIKGPKGELKKEIDPRINVSINEKEIVLSPVKSDEFLGSFWGTYTAHVSNMVSGVSKGFEKKLLIEGVGYKVEQKGDSLVFALGFSHPVVIKIPEVIKVMVEKNSITISGIDREKVGQFTAQLRELKKPEPYKGKGIKYDKEVITMKQGKKSV